MKFFAESDWFLYVVEENEYLVEQRGSNPWQDLYNLSEEETHSEYGSERDRGLDPSAASDLD